MTDIKLTDAQLVVLSAASQRPNLCLHPLPPSIKGGAAAKIVSALIGKGLAERVQGKTPDQPLERISRKGLDAIGIQPEEPEVEGVAFDQHADPGPILERQESEPPAAEASAEAQTEPTADRAPKRPRPGTKLALLIEMLRSPEGATVGEVSARTGWLKHTVRGAIAGNLKKKLGLTVDSEKVEGRGRIYRIKN